MNKSGRGREWWTNIKMWSREPELPEKVKNGFMIPIIQNQKIRSSQLSQIKPSSAHRFYTCIFIYTAFIFILRPSLGRNWHLFLLSAPRFRFSPLNTFHKPRWGICAEGALFSEYLVFQENSPLVPLVWYVARSAECWVNLLDIYVYIFS